MNPVRGVLLYTTRDPHSLFSNPSLDILLTWARAPPDMGRIRSLKRVAALCPVLKINGNKILLRKLSKELQSFQRLNITNSLQSAQLLYIWCYILRAR